ncbi:MAG: transglycosylase SLT domain-containing protein [Candidatus Eiseniibacteriota bacterium]
MRPSAALAALVLFVSPAPLVAEEATPAPADRVSDLLSRGLEAEAERMMAEALAGGAAWARVPRVRLTLARGDASGAARLVEDWGGPDSLASAANRFLFARIREMEDRFADAAEEYARAAATEPLLADHAMYRSALNLVRIGRAKDALAAFEQAGAAARTRSLAAKVYWEAARLAFELADAERALADLERVPRRSVIALADLLELEAKVARLSADAEREARVLRELVDRAASADQAVSAIERLQELGPPNLADRIDFADAALANRHPSLAEQHAQAVLVALEDAPDAALEGAARRRLGEALLARGRFSQARDELERMPRGASEDDRAEALLDRARCLWKLGQIDACLAEYDRIADGDWPEEVRAAAFWEAAREAKDNRRWEEAALRLGEFQRLFPAHEQADDAAWHRGRALVELGHFDEAAAALELLRIRYPDSPLVPEATYWKATLAERAGDPASACAEYERLLGELADSFWAERVRARRADSSCAPAQAPAAAEGEDPVAWVARLVPGTDTRSAGRSAERIEESEPFRRGALLAVAGLGADAEAELATLRSSLERDTVGLVLFAESASRAGVPREAMRAVLVVKSRVGRQILSGDFPARVARLLYPVVHVDSVRRWSREHDLDPWFTYAVMREESWFDASAVSGAGAVGLLQVMPATGRDLARRAGIDGFEREDLFRPETNIRLGTRYLSELLRDLDGEPALALSAYNAGKGNALRWRSDRHAPFDTDTYVAGITYAETYGYVQKVTRSWAIYRHLYGELVETLQPAPADPN